MDQFSANNPTDVKMSKKPWWSNSTKIYLFVLLLIMMFVMGMVSGTRYNKPYDSKQVITKTSQELKNIFLNKGEVDVDLFTEVWEIIHNDYLDQSKVSDKALFYGALTGMVDALGDPHSMFLNPELTKEFTQELGGSFFGIGAEIGRRDGYLVIVAPLAGSPAEKAGLKSGDRILKVDGRDMSSISSGEAVGYIRGEKGTEVSLTIFSPGSESAREVKITRGKIDIPSVIYEKEDGIAILKISHFNDDTDDRFASAVQQVLNDNPSGIIVDLRNNPGGFLETAINVAGYWLEPNTVVVRETFSDKRKDKEYTAGKKTGLRNFKTVVLVNEGSASGAEILAGALQDYGLAKIVGMNTYGKGSVQQLLELKDNSSVKITVARWLTPKGRTIEGEGITPDYEVDYTIEDYNNDLDPQLERAKELIFE